MTPRRTLHASTSTVVALVLAVILMASRPAAAAPLPVRVTQGEVVVRAEGGLERIARRLAARAEGVLARVATDLPGLRPPPRVEIRVVDDARQLADVAPAGRFVPPWAIGVAFRGTGIVAVATSRAGAPVDVDGTLAHELAHLALDAALGPDVPRWLHEGFAMLHAPDWAPERADVLFGMAWLGSAIPLAQLDAGFPAEEAPAHRAYAQSLDLVTFLARRGRWSDADDDGDRWPFRRFLRALSEGQTVDAAARTAFGAPLEALAREWQQDLQRRYLFLPVGLFMFLLWLVASVLLVLAWRRRRRQNRERLGRWAVIEAEAAARAAAERAAAEPPPRPDGAGGSEEPPRWLN